MRKNVFLVILILAAFALVPVLVFAEDAAKSSSAPKQVQKPKYDASWGKGTSINTKPAAKTEKIAEKAETKRSKTAAKAEAAIKRTNAKVTKKATIKGVGVKAGQTTN